MIRLPISLEKKLEALFPRMKEREQFVATIIADALEKPLADLAPPPTSVGGTLHLFTDGGSRGNPGQAAIGCVLVDPVSKRVLKEHSEAIGIQTNNVAEYQALIAGLKMALEFRPNHLLCFLDSELAVKQLTGEYRVKMQSFQPLIEAITQLVAQFPDVQFCSISRSENARADKLVNRALDALQ